MPQSQCMFSQCLQCTLNNNSMHGKATDSVAAIVTESTKGADVSVHVQAILMCTAD